MLFDVYISTTFARCTSSHIFPPPFLLLVTPKKGRAVLWSSVKDEDPNEKDERTTHQALPVVAGVKYGANAWIHQRDFKGPNQRGCSS